MNERKRRIASEGGGRNPKEARDSTYTGVRWGDEKRRGGEESGERTLLN